MPLVVTVKAEDVQRGMELIGPKLFADCGTVERVQALPTAEVRIFFTGGGVYINRPFDYEFEVLA